MDSKSSWEALRKQKGLDIPKDSDIKQAINSIYGQKSITDMNLECAISEKIDLTKPEDVVLALGYAYAYMYHRSDDDDAERVRSKYYELLDAYDMSTGKPENKSANKSNNGSNEYRLKHPEKEVREASVAIDRVFEWAARECVKNSTRKDLAFEVATDLAFALNAAYEYMYYKANDKDEEQAVLGARNRLLNRYGPKILNFPRKSDTIGDSEESEIIKALYASIEEGNG